MRRALAVVAAIVMISLAFVIRSWRHGDGDGNANGSTPGQPSTLSATIVCAAELRKVCDQLHAANPGILVLSEDAGRTFTTLIAADFDPARARIDGWLAPSPWAAMADISRQRRGAPAVLGPATRVLGRSPLVMIVWNDRRQALQQRCGGEPGWRCIGEVAGTPWADVSGSATWGGEVKPGITSPTSSAEGLLLAGQATAGYFGRADFASNDFTDDGFRRWFTQLATASAAALSSGGTNTSATPLDRMLAAGPSTFDLAGSTEATAAPLVATGRDKARLTILYPSPLSTADITMTPMIASTKADQLKALLESNGAASILAASGYRIAGQPLPVGARTDLLLPPDDGLPRAGVLDALRASWQETAK